MAGGKCITKETPYVPLEKGQVRLYSMRFCPYADRIRLVLNHLDVTHEIVNINFKSKPEWFLEKAPLGTVPVLEVGDKVIFDSAIIGEYLDRVYGESKLLSTDPWKIAKQRMSLEVFSKITTAFYGVLMCKTKEEGLEAVIKIKDNLKSFEKHLEGTYFAGDQIGLADFFIYPWFQRFDILEHIVGDGDAKILTAEQFPKLSEWNAIMENQPDVKKAFQMPLKDRLAFMNQYRNTAENPSPNYDEGL